MKHYGGSLPGMAYTISNWEDQTLMVTLEDELGTCRHLIVIYIFSVIAIYIFAPAQIRQKMFRCST